MTVAVVCRGVGVVRTMQVRRAARMQQEQGACRMVWDIVAVAVVVAGAARILQGLRARHSQQRMGPGYTQQAGVAPDRSS